MRLHRDEGSSFARQQAEYMTAPERFAEMSDSSCNAGAVHTCALRFCAAGPGNAVLAEQSHHGSANRPHKVGE
jgi:hypothetical protein